MIQIFSACNLRELLDMIIKFLKIKQCFDANKLTLNMQNKVYAICKNKIIPQVELKLEDLCTDVYENTFLDVILDNRI